MEKKESVINVPDLDGLKEILSSKKGRQYLWDLIDFCGIYRQSFTGNSTASFLQGKQAVGLKLLGDIQMFPEMYLFMIKESFDASKKKEKGKEI
jgi:hypothetical protein